MGSAPPHTRVPSALPHAARFRPAWAAIMEWESGANGRFSRMIASASGSIDRLAPR